MASFGRNIVNLMMLCEPDQKIAKRLPFSAIKERKKLVVVAIGNLRKQGNSAAAGSGQ